MSTPSTEAVVAALETLRAAGFFVERNLLSLKAAAARLDVSSAWVRAHLEEFPRWFRLPAGSAAGRNCGEIRIPAEDLESFSRRQLGRRKVATIQKKAADGIGQSRKESFPKMGLESGRAADQLTTSQTQTPARQTVTPSDASSDATSRPAGRRSPARAARGRGGVRSGARLSNSDGLARMRILRKGPPVRFTRRVSSPPASDFAAKKTALEAST